MKTYSHDYTLPAKASGMIYRAYHAIKGERPHEAEKLLLEARQMLDLYLSKDNMLPDYDCADGWVRQSDVVGHEIHNDH